jgi:stage II sporulation protein D
MPVFITTLCLRVRIFPLLLPLFLLLPAASLRGSDSFSPEMIRVAVLKGDTVKLDGDGFLASDDRGEPLRMAPPLQLKPERGGISAGGKICRKIIVSAPSPVSVNGKRYRGILEVMPAEKGLLVVNELPLEDYLVGLINCEISSQWPMEAIKAQAVVARTYALYQKGARTGATYHLESSVLDQVYDGCEIEDGRAARGVRETEGEVVTSDGRIIQSFFHSNCGGHTEAAENVWAFPLPYLQGVRCEYCSTAPSLKWEQTLPLRKLESLLKAGGIQISGLRDIRCGGKNPSGRITDLTLVSGRGEQQVLPAVKFRKIIGYTVIRSTNFSVRISGGDAVFTGLGYGHGVGLCQWGARQRAMDGFSHREIISYYYPGTKIRKMYGN